MNVHVLVLEDCTAVVPLGFADLFRKMALLPMLSPGLQVRTDVTLSLVSPTGDRTVTTAGGVRVTCERTLQQVRRSDLVLVPAVDPDVTANLERHRAVVTWLKRIFLSGAEVASACTGAFLLAEAGLLDRRSATTHWAFADLFRSRYPKVKLQPEAIIVDQGRVVTAGAATSFLPLTLYLLERIYGANAARAAGRLFAVDPNKSPQSAYAVFNPQRTHGDEDILRAQDLIESAKGRLMSVDQVAKQVGMSRRNFVRRFKEATGNVPRQYAQRSRVEAAKRVLENGSATVFGAARASGYEDLVAFRETFRRWTGLTPSEYRVRYGPRTAPATLTAEPRRLRA